MLESKHWKSLERLDRLLLIFKSIEVHLRMFDMKLLLILFYSLVTSTSSSLFFLLILVPSCFSLSISHDIGYASKEAMKANYEHLPRINSVSSNLFLACAKTVIIFTNVD